MAQPASNKASANPMWKLSGLGMEFAAGIIGMAGLGWAIDTWLLKSGGHAGLLVCAGVGIIGGGYNFIRRALALNKEAAAAYKAAHPHGSPKRAAVAQDSMFNRTEGEILEEDDDDTLTKLWSDVDNDGEPDRPSPDSTR
jgi:F0F1-type ATP synthase assembly protein I